MIDGELFAPIQVRTRDNLSIPWAGLRKVRRWEPLGHLLILGVVHPLPANVPDIGRVEVVVVDLDDFFYGNVCEPVGQDVLEHEHVTGTVQFEVEALLCVHREHRLLVYRVPDDLLCVLGQSPNLDTPTENVGVAQLCATLHEGVLLRHNAKSRSHLMDTVQGHHTSPRRGRPQFNVVAPLIHLLRDAGQAPQALRHHAVRLI